MKQNELLKAYGTEYKEMTKRLLKKADLVSLLKSKTCSENLSIGIKPNLVSPVPASFGATTHPEVVAGIIEFLKENGYDNITILEGSWVGDKTSDSFEYCGFNELARTYDVKIFDTQKDTSKKVSLEDYEVNICSILDSIDFLINVPVLKGHCQTKMTCALKNLKGVIPNSEKRRSHLEGLHRPIAYINKAIHQDFIVVDHICGDPDFEEGGNPLVTNCVMVGLDPVLIDSYACKELGIKASDVEYVMLAEKLGIGNFDLSKACIITVEGDEKGVLSLSHKLLEVKYLAEEVDSCSACYAALTEALEELKDEGLTEFLDTKICIGQGYKNAPSCDTKIGIGACCASFNLNVKGCPPTKKEIYSYLKEYIKARQELLR